MTVFKIRKGGKIAKEFVRNASRSFPASIQFFFAKVSEFFQSLEKLKKRVFISISTF